MEMKPRIGQCALFYLNSLPARTCWSSVGGDEHSPPLIPASCGCDASGYCSRAQALEIYCSKDPESVPGPIKTLRIGTTANDGSADNVPTTSVKGETQSKAISPSIVVGLPSVF